MPENEFERKKRRNGVDGKSSQKMHKTESKPEWESGSFGD